MDLFSFAMMQATIRKPVEEAKKIILNFPTGALRT